MIPASLALCVLLSWLLTLAMRRYALHHQILDRPNERSSHSVPTPRGGGVAIVVSFLLVAAVFSWLAPSGGPGALPPSLLAATAAIAIVGWLDDRSSLKARWRFLAHTLVAVWMLWVMGGIPSVPMFGVRVDLGWFGLALATAYIVWMVNLFNFMDGIDGIASTEAITVCLSGALCWWLATASAAWHLPALLAASAAGFLAWNYPPARIFMGDSGSGFLGAAVALFSLWTAQAHQQVFWCWFILIGCFMVDATTTLVRRVRRGERFSEAHRTHAYQYASRRHGSHKVVTLAVAAINVLWLLPIAVLVALGHVDGVAASIVAYAPLVVLAFRYKAGARSLQEV